VTGKRWPRCFWLYARWPDRDGHVAKPVLGGRLKGERDPLSCLETAIAIHDNHGEVRPATSGGLCRVDYAESLVGTPLSNRSFRGHAASMTFRPVDSSAGIQTRSDQSATSDLSLPAVHIRPENYKVVHPCGSQRGSHRPGTTTLWVLVTIIGPLPVARPATRTLGHQAVRRVRAIELPRVGWAAGAAGVPGTTGSWRCSRMPMASSSPRLPAAPSTWDRARIMWNHVETEWR
jgi:hypothetical protein